MGKSRDAKLRKQTLARKYRKEKNIFYKKKKTKRIVLTTVLIIAIFGVAGYFGINYYFEVNDTDFKDLISNDVHISTDDVLNILDCDTYINENFNIDKLSTREIVKNEKGENTEYYTVGYRYNGSNGLEKFNAIVRRSSKHTTNISEFSLSFLVDASTRDNVVKTIEDIFETLGFSDITILDNANILETDRMYKDSNTVGNLKYSVYVERYDEYTEEKIDDSKELKQNYRDAYAIVVGIQDLSEEGLYKESKEAQ